MPRTYVVESEQVAAVLARGHGTTYLQPYFEGPTSISEAARKLSRPIARVHYWTHRWHDLGLLEVVEVVERKGRAIRRYRTVADVIEVPPDLLPHAMFQAQMARDSKEIVAALDAAAPEVVRGGLLRVHQPAGQRGISVDRTTLSPGRLPRGVLQTSFGLELDRSQARQLQGELEDLRDRWLGASGRSGPITHLVSLALAPAQRP